MYKCRHCDFECDNPIVFYIHERNCLDHQKQNGLIKEEQNQEPPIDYNSMTVDQLKNVCKEKGLEGYSNLNKDDLVAFMNENIKG